ncbi:MAG: hypothetical protein DRQ46_00160 [Gammaproteobacteria bacterium]|nr:MAG: hypothetical protein DRQ46_00160 [Gammaproteobacteria bacterium]
MAKKTKADLLHQIVNLEKERSKSKKNWDNLNDLSNRQEKKIAELENKLEKSAIEFIDKEKELLNEKRLSKYWTNEYNKVRFDHADLFKKNEALAEKLAKAYQFKMKYEVIKEVHLSIMTGLVKSSS